MSVWSESPEWFDEWLEQQALDGRFGPEEQKLAEDGNFNGDLKAWDRLDTKGDLGQEAMESYCDRWIP